MHARLIGFGIWSLEQLIFIERWSVRIVVSIVDFDYTPSSIDPGSNPGRTSFFYHVDLRAFFYNQNVMMLQNSASTWKLHP